jgi:voltage-gated potassium channel
MPVAVLIARMMRRLRRRKSLGFGLVLLAVLVSLLGNATCFWVFDSPDSFEDALWYSVISITTIGYGDHYAQSLGARLGTLVFIIGFGLSAFTVFLGMVVDWGMELALRGRYGMGKAMAKDHVIIVNFTSALRVRRLIEELQSDVITGNREVVVVADTIERLPFDLPNVLFVRGSPLAVETLQRASVDTASMAIVLAPSEDEATSDAVVSAAVAVLDDLKPELQIVAECLDERHDRLFRSVHCDGIVYGQVITDHLLVQEVADPGISQMIDTITSNIRGDTLYSAEVTHAVESTWNVVAKALLDADVNLLCVNRGETSYTRFSEVSPEPGDRVIFLSQTRHAWPQLLELAGMG